MTGPHPFRRAAESKDLDLLAETLRKDVVLHSPVLFRGFEGRETVLAVLTHVAATTRTVASASSPSSCAPSRP